MKLLTNSFVQFIIIIVLIIFDFVTKKIIFNYIELNELFSIFFIIDITHVHNYGISFGLFSGILSKWLIIFLGLIMVIIILFWIYQSSNEFEKWGLIFILSGALSNIIDRVINNYVLDFIFLNYNGYYWPAFNLADIYISIGIFIIIIESLKLLKTRLKR